MINILTAIAKLRSKRKYRHDTLYCLYGIKPIEEDLEALDECMVGRE